MDNIKNFNIMNNNYTFEITHRLFFLDGKTIKGYEGIIRSKDRKNQKGQKMMWDAQGTALSKDRGLDLVIRKTIHG